MKKIHVLTLAAIFLLSTIGSAQQNAPAAEDKASAPPPGTVTGSGTANYIPMWTGSTTLGNSYLYQNGGVGINTTAPHYSLDVNGHINSASGYLIGGSLALTMPGGSANSNIAVGYQALLGTGGSQNTAVGTGALENNNGNANTANGYAALINSTGSGNTALGAAALASDSTGSYNIAIGYDAAAYVSGGNSNNIHIGSQGASTDSGTVRIGMSGFQTSFFAAGIYGVSSGSNSAIPVLVDSSGQLVTVSSSRRFKEDIQDMADASRDLMRLHPVTFRYKKPFNDGSQPMQYGLIAEEVAEVYPDLVARSADGQIETVKYQLLDPMPLNEVQRQQAEIRELEERLNKIESALLQTTAGSQPK